MTTSKTYVFTVNGAEALSTMMPVAGFVCGDKHPTPVYGFVMFKMSSGNLFVQSISGGQCITRMVQTNPMEVCEDFTMCLEANKLRSILGGLKDADSITFEVSLSGAVIKSGRSKLKCDVMSAEGFPTPPKVADDAFSALINFNDLSDVVRKTRHAMATNDVRYYLNGLHMHFNSGSLSVSGSDGHRLSSFSISGLQFDGQAEVIVPKKMVDLIGADKGDKGEVRVKIDANMVEFTWSTGQIRSQSIDGKFPNVGQFLNSDVVPHAKVNRHSFLQSLSRVKSVSDTKNPAVCLSNDNSELKLCAVTVQNEVTGEDYISGSFCESAFRERLGANAIYLAEALSSFDDEELVLSQSTGTGFLMLSPATGGTKREIVMPFRI